MARLDTKLGLGIDFATFDRDLKAVADKIESAGKAAAVKAGGVAGSLAGGKLDTGEITDLVSSVGTRLSLGMADGVRRSSELMLGFTARIDRAIDTLTGSAVEMFRRIDSAMKFPAFDAFFATSRDKLSNFTRIWKKPLSDLDLALSGSLGGMIGKLAGVLQALFDRLAATIGGAVKQAVSDLALEFGKVTGGIQQSEAAAQDLFRTAQAAAKVQPKFPAFAPVTNKRPGTGRALGANVDFEAALPKLPPPPTQWQEFARTLRGDLSVAFQAGGDSAIGFGAIFSKIGAALVSIPLKALVPFLRLTNFLGSLGDVGKKSFSGVGASAGLLTRAVQGTATAVAKLTAGIFHVGTLGAFRSVGTQAQAATQGVRSLGREILAAFGVAGVIFKTVQFFKDAVVGASDLNETVSRSKVVFGDSFGPVEAQAKGMARAFGLSRQAQLDVASGFGQMAQGAGFSEEASASLANQLTKMAADLSSSVNIPFEEAGAKIRSALAGEAEPLRQFGANVTETNVKAYALASGMKLVGGALSDQNKITARAALIMQQLGYAQNDLERTSDSAANQFRKAGGGITEFGVRIGELLLPAVKLATEAFNELLGSLLEVFEANQPVIQSWAEKVTDVMRGVGVLARNFGDFWQIARLRVGEFVSNTLAWFETLPANFGPITEWLGRNWFNLLKDMAAMIQAPFANIAKNAANLGSAVWHALRGEPWEFAFTPLLDGFKATTEKLPELIKPELISVQGEVDRIMAGITAKETERLKNMAKAGAPVPKKPGPIAPEASTKAAEYKLASAVEIGSKEAYSIVARSLSSGAKDAAAKRQLDVAKQQLAVQKEIAEAAKKGGVRLAVK